MKNRKCAGCGLVNFPSASDCKRCGAPLEPYFAFEGADAPEGVEGRGILRRALAVPAVLLFLLVGCHASLLFTSEGVTYDERRQVSRAVELIERAGFERETFLLKRLTNFRTTDNWLNAYAGHANAYASTNFPFEIVTLYPDFFRYPADDVERAVILLHEARHLAGADEEEACASVWRDKERLGWTREKYGKTRVWQNVAELSRRFAPQLFDCGEDGQQDCYE
ncbi:MAG TPA: zinc finger Ran-binding domain-containing protein [Pyrinomonadaceae bacterium]|nr:zinc finger Ran-binding domain-containing protein [Pyrinomonadaceae bacterium]